MRTFSHSSELVYLKMGWLIALGVCVCIFNKPLKAATATASVTANIIIAMSLTTQSSMAFGDISASSTSGSIILHTTGDRSSIGGATVNSAVLGNPAEFIAAGEPGAVFSISMPSTVQLTGPTNNSMMVDNFTSEPIITGQLDASGNKSVIVGATLHVGSQQAFGSYTGLMALNVDYN